MSQSLLFRPATLVDVPAIVSLVESAYRGEVSKQGWTTEADMLEGQRTDPDGVGAIIGKPDSCVLLVQVGDELVACCHIEKQVDAGYFGMFSVAPTQQGSGIGKLVLAEAERIAREEWRCVRMEMTVIDIRNELIAWYERRGYHRSGIKKPFPYGDARFGIPKRDDLRFEILSKALS
jgi:ribosomal protein S18 acetylase RimI-like enzyme